MIWRIINPAVTSSGRDRYAVMATLLLAVLSVASMRAAESPPSPPATATAIAAEKQFSLAQGLLARKFYDLAETEFTTFLNDYAQHKWAAEAAFYLSECQRAQGRSAAAVETVDQALQRWPASPLRPKLQLIKGDILLAAGNCELAATAFRQVLDCPDTVAAEAATYFLAQCEMTLGHADRGLELYRQLAERPFDDRHHYRPYALFALAAAAEQGPDQPNAANYYAQLLGGQHLPPAVREEALFRAAELAFKSGSFKLAIEYFTTLLTSFPDGHFADLAERRRLWAYFSQDNYEQVISLAQEWRRHHTGQTSYEIDYLHGISAVGLDQCNVAVNLFRQVAATAGVPAEYRRLARYQQIYCLVRLGENPEVPALASAFLRDYKDQAAAADVAYFGGTACAAQSQWDKAVSFLEAALKQAGKDWKYERDSRLQLAESYRQSGKVAEAATLFRQLAAGQSPANTMSLLLTAAELSETSGQITVAANDLNQLIRELPPEHAGVQIAILRLARIYSRSDNSQTAAAGLDALLPKADTTTRPRIALYLGYIRYRERDYTAAEKIFRDIVATTIKAQRTQVAIEANYYLAATLLELNKTAEARQIFTGLLKLPDDLRPAFPEALLGRLMEQYFLANDYVMSELTGRLLSQSSTPALAYRGNIRLTELMIANHRLESARQLLTALEQRLSTDPQWMAAVQNDADLHQAPDEIMALSGEVYLLTDQPDRALRLFQKCLANPGQSQTVSARARWGLASILRQDKRNDEALRQAVSVFVLGNDPIYTPRAMLLAVEILAEQGKGGEAVTTWKELTARFPAFAAQHVNDAMVKQVTTMGDQQNNEKPQQTRQ